MLLFTNKKPSKIPIVVYSSNVSAGFPSPADDHTENKLDLNEYLIQKPAATFFARVEGESMKNSGIFDGDLLIVDRSLYPQEKDIVIAVIQGEMTLKRLKKINESWLLSAENSLFPDIPIDENGCEIWGVVIHSIRKHYNR
ncbi:MAG: DNA polymerase V [Rhodospirillaceae bacterium]|nr:DNA polymerase V [Rhodospirillaceae bacterium]|tara:strand:+ start:3142 stop:3564 length:423 start_codon:yes stop_codon:yes gene_type:complete